MIKDIFYLGGLFILISCGKDAQLPGQRSEKIVYTAPAEHEPYSYEFVTKTCTTGIKTYSTFIKACEGLMNEKVNNDCAFEQRSDLYTKSGCDDRISKI